MTRRVLGKLAFPVCGIGMFGSLIGTYYSGGIKERQSVFDGPETHIRLTQGWWEEKWSLGQTGWKKTEYDFDGLLKRANLKKSEMKGKKILVTLCGDCQLVSDLSKSGALVTAIDFSPTAIQSLKAKLPADSNVEVLEQDWLTSGLGQKYDMIFDKAGLTSVDPIHQQQYIKQLEKVTSPGSKVVLDLIVRSKTYSGGRRGNAPPSNVEYAPWIRAPNVVCGPPFHFPPTAVEEQFSHDAWDIAFTADMEDSIVEKLSDKSVHLVHYLSVLTRK
eukprot:TRINITY_DN16365_c0_g1_i1.p1 TRINITY_DN16365_c0_g1~~TRINITY_DN16365_c0_g1_i1.p1  ORF type:complete len:274 (+),score=51.11 TRINITY_DN16365_c0_g1_i1:65-886(+)